MKKYERQRAIQIMEEKKRKTDYAMARIEASYAMVQDNFVHEIIRTKGRWYHRWLQRHPKIWGLWFFKRLVPRIYRRVGDLNYFKVGFRGEIFDIIPYMELLSMQKQLREAPPVEKIEEAEPAPEKEVVNMHVNGEIDYDAK